uniref:Uncharacterized protein n=1 Tax=Plectus sambesii TaxID=2011161 RepID=A0A914UUB9_9BILA
MVPVVDESINTLSLRPDRRTSPIAALSGGREQKVNQRGLGLLVGMPGIDPMYFGGFVNNEKDKPLNLGLAPGSN